jgi:predicted nucleic acid-binding protein
VRIAVEQSERFRISYWDAAILAAADAYPSWRDYRSHAA